MCVCVCVCVCLCVLDNLIVARKIEIRLPNGLHIKAHKTEYTCFNQTGDISTQDGSSMKLVDKFTY